MTWKGAWAMQWSCNGVDVANSTILCAYNIYNNILTFKSTHYRCRKMKVKNDCYLDFLEKDFRSGRTPCNLVVPQKVFLQAIKKTTKVIIYYTVTCANYEFQTLSSSFTFQMMEWYHWSRTWALAAFSNTNIHTQNGESIYGKVILKKIF